MSVKYLRNYLTSLVNGNSSFPGDSLTDVRSDTILQLRVRASQRAALASATRKSNSFKLRKYLQFCLEIGLDPVPATSNSLCLYAEYLARTFKSVQSIKAYLFTVANLHRMCKVHPPDLKHYDLEATLRGIRRKKKHMVRKAAPITPYLLIRFRQFLDLNDPFQATIWALFLTSFFLLLRKSNVTPIHENTFNSEQILLRSDLRISPSTVLVHIKWSKTMQCGENEFLAPLLPIPNSALCPVWAINNMIRKVPANSVCPAFCLPNGSPITYSTFLASLKMLISAIGKDPSIFSCHSFRRGGTVWCHKAQVGTRLLMLHGTWRSDCYKEYLDHPLHDRTTVFSKMRQAIIESGF